MKRILYGWSHFLAETGYELNDMIKSHIGFRRIDREPENADDRSVWEYGR